MRREQAMGTVGFYVDILAVSGLKRIVAARMCCDFGCKYVFWYTYSQNDVILIEHLIGRKKEIEQLNRYLTSAKSEFVAIYGRRRVGKTFLVRQVYSRQFSFQLTGLANVGKQAQLAQFHAEYIRQFDLEEDTVPARDWFSAFRQLVTALENLGQSGKKVIFLDELPWLDTKGSNFLSGLEHFWNSWASARADILLVVCGSAASWMVKNLLNNRGGLHNRITGRIKLDPFTLSETAAFFDSKEIKFNRYQIVLLYMVFGGIPFYLEQIDGSLSAVQNINNLCFTRNAPFRTEYGNLYASLFSKPERHTAVIEALAKKNKGLTRTEIIGITSISDGGGLTRILKELEESNFIRKYRAFGRKERDKLYQLMDPYSLFYLKFIKQSSTDDENFWTNALESPTFRSWSGYAFEMVCLHHVKEIKEALKIGGVQTSVSTWNSSKAQIDLIIDRKDQVINLCEMKFSIHPFSIDQQYAANLRKKIGSFQADTGTKKALFLTMITTYGVNRNSYSGMVQNDLHMDIFF
ncbi:MAG: ATP-binding protein [Bacteroidota bacterium]